MSKVKLLTTSEDMSILHAACDRGNKYAQVSKSKLHNLLLDHAKLLQRLRPGDVETNVEDLL